MSNWVDVIAAEELPPGDPCVVEVNGSKIAVFNLEGEYYAIADMCTHDGGELACGWVKGDEIACPRHGATFNIKTGKVTAPPAVEDVVTYPIRVEQGMVQVDAGAAA